MNTKREIIEHLGADAIADVMGVAKLRVQRLQKNEEKLPASWYWQLSQMCGEDLPRHLFSFKGAA